MGNTFRSTAIKTTNRAVQRLMGTHAAPKNWTGADAIVRKYFPEDYQVAGAILSLYGVVISLAVLRSKLKSSPPEPVPTTPSTTVVTAVASSDTIPTTDSPDFEKFINDDDALGKFVESEERMMKWIDTLSKD